MPNGLAIGHGGQYEMHPVPMHDVNVKKKMLQVARPAHCDQWRVICCKVPARNSRTGLVSAVTFGFCLETRRSSVKREVI